ncbi:MAG: tetratricopeptide repeat protein [Acidobacteriia bacterium]|nr:tetratricopeptide repeat protein [Terriglobia bacterium]
MTGFGRALLLIVGLGCVVYAQTPAATANGPADNRAGAYYNFAMGRLYTELAASSGNSREYIAKAIQHYQDALKQDPSASFIFEELTDLYIQTNRLRDAVTQAEDMLKQNPDNLEARRMLGRIYTRMLGDPQQGKINEEMLRRAMEQYQKITEKDPKDADSWVILGRLYRVANNSADEEKAFNAALKAEPDNEDALTGLAQLYLDLGDINKAIDKLKSATDRNPNERTLMALALAYEQIHDYKNAAAVLKQAVGLSADNTRLRQNLARDLFAAQQYDEALAVYQQLASEDPKDTTNWLRISELYRAKRDFPKSQEAFARAKALEPDNLDVRYAEISLLDAQGKTDQAIGVLKGLLEETARKTYSAAESDSRVRLLERLGLLYAKADQYEQAVETFRQIIPLDAERAPQVAAQIIETYQTAKDYESAAREAEAAKKKFPNEKIVVLAHASVLADRGKTDDAAAEIRTLVKAAPDLDTQLALAQVYDKGKRFANEAKAIDEAEKSATGDQDKVRVLFMRGAMYERMKNYDGAEAEFGKVLKLDPDNSGAMNYLGYMLAFRNMRLDEAHRLISKALETDPDNGAYLDSLGWVYYQQGKLTEAESELVRAAGKIGDDPTVHDHLGDLYLKMGKTKDAITQWQTSLRRYQAGAPADNDPEDIAKINKKLESARVRLAKETGQK